MREKGVLILLTTILLLATASSVSLNITTIPYHDVWVSAFKPSSQSESVALPVKFTSDSTGKLLMDYDVDEDFILALKLKDGENTLLYKKFTEVYSPNSIIELEFYPKEYVPIEITPITTNEIEETLKEVLNNTNLTIELTDMNLSQNNEISTESFSVILDKFTLYKKYAGYTIFTILLILLIILIVRPRNPKSKMKLVDKKIKNAERRIEKLKEKRRKLFIKIKENLIRGEEDLIKMRGGSIPGKEDKTPMLKRLKEALKKKK